MRHTATLLQSWAPLAHSSISVKTECKTLRRRDNNVVILRGWFTYIYMMLVLALRYVALCSVVVLHCECTNVSPQDHYAALACIDLISIPAFACVAVDKSAPDFWPKLEWMMTRNKWRQCKGYFCLWQVSSRAYRYTTAKGIVYAQNIGPIFSPVVMTVHTLRQKFINRITQLQEMLDNALQAYALYHNAMHEPAFYVIMGTTQSYT